MKDYVVYHKPEKMGGPVTEFPACEAVTGKNVKEEIIGSRVWLITGEGKPRTYFLRSCFIVDQIVVTPKEKYPTKLLGRTEECQEFNMIKLSGKNWFEEFRHKQGNFGLGLQVIDSYSLSHLKKLGME